MRRFLSLVCTLLLVSAIGPALAQSTVPAPLPAAAGARGVFTLAPYAGSAHRGFFDVRGEAVGGTGGIVVFDTMLHVAQWPAGAAHDLTYHFVINGTPMAKKTVSVPDTNAVELSYTITGIAPDNRFSAQVVSDAPFVHQSRTFSAVETCTGRGTGGCHLADPKQE